MRRPSRFGWFLIALLIYMIGVVAFSVYVDAQLNAPWPDPVHVQRPGRCGG